MTSSLSAFPGFLAFVIACATSIPFAPSFMACCTSFFVWIPAPQSTGILILCVVFVITSGSASDTEIFPPISSGGSIAIKSGLYLAICIASFGVAAHAIDIILSFLSRSIVFFICCIGILCSE